MQTRAERRQAAGAACRTRGPLGAACAGPERSQGRPHTRAAAGASQPTAGPLPRVGAAPDPTTTLLPAARPPRMRPSSLRMHRPQAGRWRGENQNAARRAAGHVGSGSQPQGTLGPPSPSRRRAPRGPMGTAPGRPALCRRMSVPGHGRRRCRVLELSPCGREPTVALSRPRGRAEVPPGQRGAAAAAAEEAAAGDRGGRRSRAHGVHFTEELPRPGTRPLPGAPRRLPQR